MEVQTLDTAQLLPPRTLYCTVLYCTVLYCTVLYSRPRTLVTVVTTCAVSASQHLSLPTPGSVRLRPGQPRPRLRLRLRLPPCWRPRWSRAARPRVRRAGLPQPTHEYTTNFKLAELRRGTWANQSEDSIRTG